MWDFLVQATRAKLALGFDPVVEVPAVGAPAAQVAVVRGFGDLVIARTVRRAVTRGFRRRRASGVGGLRDRLLLLRRTGETWSIVSGHGRHSCVAHTL